ncbi:RNA polymerase sigma-70 factor, ECF subfamily [Amphibacillus marinus]|uniref:RNA polymerase sigma-70 factor, ECF subfamily n=1 Tax=Amphibacillus marinus TaxID=872970 RepID=A0A1H8LNF7_9BACI|nr:RNA polymerase sigma factor [Amphibacillus marinus]SEO06629.1 RNA polymerase sigma-70 factor, ECF subfamily [Amphibacillus marinus]
MTEMFNDEEIDFGFNNASQRSFADVYQLHVETIYRICYTMVGNKGDAEDMCQSVFIKLLEKQRSFANVNHEHAWLITTAKNQCIDLHRSRLRRKVIQFDIDLLGWEGLDQFEYQDLEEQLKKLPPLNRLIIYLHYYEGYKLAEIAKLLQVNLNTIKTRMRRAKKVLSTELGGINDER